MSSVSESLVVIDLLFLTTSDLSVKLYSFVVSFCSTPCHLLPPYRSVTLLHRSSSFIAARTRHRWCSNDQTTAAPTPLDSPCSPICNIPSRASQFASNPRIRAWSGTSDRADVILDQVKLFDWSVPCGIWCVTGLISESPWLVLV
jgi:hypothetical protein